MPFVVFMVLWITLNGVIDFEFLISGAFWEKKIPQFCCEKGHEETKGLGFYWPEWNRCWKTFHLSCWWCSVTMVSIVRTHQALGVNWKQMHWCWWPCMGEAGWANWTLLKPWMTLSPSPLRKYCTSGVCMIDSNFNLNVVLTKQKQKQPKSLSTIK